MIERLGIVGGGQLGRMITETAKPMGFEVIVADQVFDENKEPYPAPATQAGARQIEVPFNDPEAPLRLAEVCDVITIEVEHVAAEVMLGLANNGVNFQPNPRDILTIQDKLTQKRHLGQIGLPVANFMPVESQSDFEIAQRELGELIVKSRRDGFDGRANLVVDDQTWPEIRDYFTEKYGDESELYAERFMPLQKELAVLVARGLSGERAVYPVTETEHKNNICHVTMTPAQIDPSQMQDATDIAIEAVDSFEGAGVFAVEMFVDGDDNILINEIAPRVHNSGHWTIEGAVTSQFEQHVRAITGLPLGETYMVKPAAVMINILGERDGPVELTGLEDVLRLPDTHVHLYGKRPTKIRRKLGHITVRGNSIDEALRIAEQARSLIRI